MAQQLRKKNNTFQCIDYVLYVCTYIYMRIYVREKTSKALPTDPISAFLNPPTRWCNQRSYTVADMEWEDHP